MEFAPQVEDLSKAVKSLPSLIDAVFALPISGWIVLVCLFSWFVINNILPKILDFMGRKETRNLEQIDAYVSTSDQGDPNAIRAIRDLRDARYFKIATGIYAERRVRNALIKMHESTSHLISWHQIRYAHQYLNVDENEAITVRSMKFWDKFGYWFNEIIGHFFLLLAAASFSLVVFSNIKSLQSLLFGVCGGILATLIAALVRSQNWPVDAAKKIAKELQKRQSVGANA